MAGVVGALLFLTVAIVPKLSAASWALSEGQPPFQLQTIPHSSEVIGGEFAVITQLAWHGRQSVSGEVAFKLPPGLSFVDGQTERRVALRPSHRETWITPVRAAHEGEFIVREKLRIKDANGGITYKGEYETRLVVHENRVTGVSVEVGSQMMREGKLYGYGGQYLVLLTPGDPLTSGVDRMPEALEKQEGVCSDCSDPVVVRFVVTVGPDGQVRWPRVQTRDKRFSQSALHAAESALLEWRYKPAKWHGRSVAHWAIAEVSVRPER